MIINNILHMLKHITFLDLPLPDEILDIICGYLGEGDLDNLVKVGNERIQYCAIRGLKKLSLIKSKFSLTGLC